MWPRYCSRCGSPLPQGGRRARPAKGPICPECHTKSELRPQVWVAGLVTREGEGGTEVLLIRRQPDFETGGGLYALPGMRVEFREDVREVLGQAFWNQAGLRSQIGACQDAHTDILPDGRQILTTWFEVTANGEPTPGAGADEARYFLVNRLPDLVLASERLVIERMVGTAAAWETEGDDLPARLQQRKRRYRELLEAYTNELMRSAWINDLHLRLSRLDTADEITRLAAEQLVSRHEVDQVRFWFPGPPDRCSECPWAQRCPQRGCLHLVTTATGAEQDPDADPIPAEEERVPLIRGLPAADVALKDHPLRAELPGAGATPDRFEGFPLPYGGSNSGVLGLISRMPMDPNARRLFEVVARHIATLVRNARLVDVLRNANEVKLGFISRMSHELKTPLTAILGYSELLRDELEAEGHQMGVEGATIIQSSGRKLLEIVESILELAKLQSGSVRLRLETLELGGLIEERLLRYLKAGRDRGLEVTLDRGETPALIKGDRARVRQVIDALVENALKFSNENSEIKIRISVGEDSVECGVQDEGIGVPAEALERIFEPFHQVSEKIHLDYGGLGLGLALVKDLVEQHGGRVGVESHLGEGSRFWFTLRRAELEPA
ncbi:MAG: hypothetical protein JKY65_20915 [Planctomycetes bacterium]|nr:hypothetical protein [Planctomycetota bacterium]